MAKILQIEISKHNMYNDIQIDSLLCHTQYYYVHFNMPSIYIDTVLHDFVIL